MKTILETDRDFICDIQAPCFQMLLPDEVELVRASKTQVLFRKAIASPNRAHLPRMYYSLFMDWPGNILKATVLKTSILGLSSQANLVAFSCFTKNTFNYSSVALNDCQVYLVEKDAIAKVVKQNGMFGFNIVKRYCGQNANLFDTLRKVMYKQMNGRMADTLLYFDNLKTENADIFQLLSRKDIADFAGISTESAVKLLKSFEKDGVIELNEKDITILDRNLLLEISKEDNRAFSPDFFYEF